jgi:hypothetical protein
VQGFRDHSPLKKIWPTLSLEKWEEEDRTKAGQIIREYTYSLLNEITPASGHDWILGAGEEFIAEQFN